MAILISCATGNWLTAGTWALVDSTSYSNSESASTAITTSYVSSSTFTPGAITIDAIAIKIATRTATIGTLSVALDLATVTVTGTEVTINVADLNASLAASLDGGWVVFKFASPVTLAGATAYGVKIKTSSVSQVVAFSSATTNWSRALRTTTTQAPVAGDDTIVAGEHTGAGTGNDFTVTMNETAATDYGSNTISTVTPALAICKRGTLKFNDASAANPKLRLSGHAIVYNGGTLNIGTVATPIPRDSVAILEFDCTADGDFGLVCRNGSTVTMQGLSRTSGKNIIVCKLTANTAVNLIQVIAITSTNFTVAAASTTFDPTATTLGGSSAAAAGFNILLACSDTVANAIHKNSWTQSASVTNATQVFAIWIKRGSGTNNRYIRLQLGSIATASPPTNGFYADFDLQAGTAGTCTAAGNGTATSASITAFGGGYICTIIGKASSAALAPISVIFACNASGGVTFTGDATQNFITTWPQVYTISAQPTDLTVDTDTGWLANDIIAIASTTRTGNECEIAQLGSNAGASTLTCALYPINYHDGLSPVQGEIILVTRNVKVRSTSPSVMAYMFVDCPSASTTSVDIDWTEFYYLGANALNKRGLEISYGGVSFAGAINVQYSSFHDCEAIGLYVNGNISNTTISNNTMWHLAINAGPACQLASASTATNYVIDNNILIHTGTGGGWTFNTIRGTITNNTVVGATAVGFTVNDAAFIGTITGLTAHSCSSAGVSVTASGVSGSFNATCWRNSSSGFLISLGVSDLILENVVAFGNLSSNIQLVGGDIWLKSPTLNGDSTFLTANGISIGAVGAGGTLLVDNGDFSTSSGIKTVHSTSDISINGVNNSQHVVLRNTKLGATTEIGSQANLSNNGYISSQRNDQTAGNHKTWMKNGTIQTDAITYNTAAPSLLMTPSSASLKLESSPQFQGLKIAINNGSTATVSVYVRKSATYNGNQPRLIQKANPALGQSNDVALATLVGGTGSWILLSGTTSTATDDGAWEIVVDCDGTAGAVNVDDFVVS